MRTGSILVRDEDGKEFRVTNLGHWSDIEAEDGETDYVKCYGGVPPTELYVSAIKGFSYKVKS